VKSLLLTSAVSKALASSAETLYDNNDLINLKNYCLSVYGHPMEKDIKGDTSGTLKMLLVSLAQGNRDENPIVDIAKSRDDAQRLYSAGN
jgi:annexin A7/11